MHISFSWRESYFLGKLFAYVRPVGCSKSYEIDKVRFFNVWMLNTRVCLHGASVRTCKRYVKLKRQHSKSAFKSLVSTIIFTRGARKGRRVKHLHLLKILESHGASRTTCSNVLLHH